MKINEIWLPVKGYENIYCVSNLGRVKSLDRKCKSNRIIKGILKTLSNSRFGYLRVGLSNNGKFKTHDVHRLVGIAHIPNPDNLYCLNHKNDIKSDNRVENLEWCNMSHNIREAFRLGLKKIHPHQLEILRKGRESTRKTVYQYDKELNLIKVWGSVVEAAKGNNITNPANVGRCCIGIRYTTKGFIWSFKPLTSFKLKNKFIQTINRKPFNT